MSSIYRAFKNILDDLFFSCWAESIHWRFYGMFYVYKGDQPYLNHDRLLIYDAVALSKRLPPNGTLPEEDL